MNDSLPSLLPKRDELLLDVGSLPTPPAIVMQIVKLLGDENVSVSDLASSVALDAALAGRVLRTVNSVAFSPASRVIRLELAISMLGLKPFRSLVMRTAMRDIVPAAESAAATEIRRRTILNATLSQAFAEELDPDIAEEAFLGGLLGALGHLVMARKAPEVHQQLRRLGQGWPHPHQENQLLGYIIDDVTGDLLSSWSMPDVLFEAIMLRSETRISWKPRSASAGLVSALRLGLLAERVLCDGDAASALGDLLAYARTVLGLDLLRLSEILVGTEPLVAELARSMNFEVPAEGEHEAVVAEAIRVLEDQNRDPSSQVSVGRD